MTEPLTKEQLDALEEDMQRQLDRTRLVPTEPLVSVNADMLRALFAAAKERSELELNLASAEQECDELRARLIATQHDTAKTTDDLGGHLAEMVAEIAKLRAQVAELEAERDEALKAIKVVQSASRTLDAGRQKVIHNLQKPLREERLAVATLDSEREANALLTGENDALRALLVKAGEAARNAAQTLRMVPVDNAVGSIAWKDAVELELLVNKIRGVMQPEPEPQVTYLDHQDVYGP